MYGILVGSAQTSQHFSSNVGKKSFADVINAWFRYFCQKILKSTPVFYVLVVTLEMHDQGAVFI